MPESEDVVRASKCGEGGKNKNDKQGHLREAMYTYCHDLLFVRAAMLVRKFPLTQRGRLRDISVGANGGCCNSACTEASPTCRLRFVERG